MSHTRLRLPAKSSHSHFRTDFTELVWVHNKQLQSNFESCTLSSLMEIEIDKLIEAIVEPNYSYLVDVLWYWVL